MNVFSWFSSVSHIWNSIMPITLHFLVLPPALFLDLRENFLILFLETYTIPLHRYIQIYLISLQYFALVN